MSLSYNRWKKLFLFCLGLSIAASFCMKWMESDLWVNGEKFTIIGLELFYPKEKLLAILTGLDGHVQTILNYHLHFDFAFMAGIFPGISALCMMAREKVNNSLLKKILFILAALQMLAWAADIRENLYLLDWIKHPVDSIDLDLFHFIVAGKWIIAVIAFIVSLFILLFRFKIKINKTHFLI